MTHKLQAAQQRYNIHCYKIINETPCAPLMLDSMNLKYVNTVKYLGVVINAAKSFRCSVQHIRIRFYRVSNSIYAKT